MYKSVFVIRRIRNTIIGMLAGVSAMGIGTFSIIAFLGRFVGTFTVALDMANVSLSLSETADFAVPVSYLRIDKLPLFQEFAYGDLDEDGVIDNEENGYLYGADYDMEGEITRLNFFKYTFYVKNTGFTEARYLFRLNVIDSTSAENGTDLLNTLRVMIYQNDVTIDPQGVEYDVTHDKDVYARARTRVYLDPDTGEEEWREPISIREDQASRATPFEGYATEFVSDSVIAELEVSGFSKDDIKRYTVVTWLEGNDADSSRYYGVPEGATIKLGVTINAYEN